MGACSSQLAAFCQNACYCRCCTCCYLCGPKFTEQDGTAISQSELEWLHTTDHLLDRWQHSDVLLLQRTFLLAVAVVPSWSEARDALAAFDADGEAGMLRNIAALAPLLSRLQDALRREGLWDVRKI